MRTEDRVIEKCHSWDDFLREVKALRTTKQRGDAFERLAHLHFQVDSKYISFVHLSSRECVMSRTKTISLALTLLVLFGSGTSTAYVVQDDNAALAATGRY